MGERTETCPMAARADAGPAITSRGRPGRARPAQTGGAGAAGAGMGGSGSSFVATKGPSVKVNRDAPVTACADRR